MVVKKAFSELSDVESRRSAILAVPGGAGGVVVGAVAMVAAVKGVVAKRLSSYLVFARKYL
jgi:hypothetical protein